MTPSAATLVRDRLARYAAALGHPGPLPARVVAILDQTFGRPVGDPGYRSNALCPGGWPVEVSFAEADTTAWRVDLQPGDPALPALERAALALHSAGIGPEAVAPWRELLGARMFGGFVGVSVPEQSPVRVKAYLELDGAADLGRAPSPVREHVLRLVRSVPGLRPHLVAVGDPLGDRLYLEATAGIALLDLFDWVPTSAMAAQLPALIDTVRQLTGGLLVLPGSSALISLRCVRGADAGVELKVELTRQALLGPSADVVERLLVDRPWSQAPFRHWRQALPAFSASVISVRIDSAGRSPRLNVYADLLDPGTMAAGAGTPAVATGGAR